MLFGLLGLAVSVSNPATHKAAPALAATNTAHDPNQRICENMTVVGSRLAVKRVCATRAEWADRRLQDRQDAESIQRSLTGSTCAGAKTAGKPVC